MTRSLLARLMTSTAALAWLAVLEPVRAQSPQTPTVIGGAVAVTRRDTTTIVTQTTDRGVIDWRSFSIGPQETVRFDQPGRSAVTLNRVTGADLSRIDGRMSANGQVWLSNPNGVMIGPGGQVAVGGLLATTGRIDPLEMLRSGRAEIDRIGKDAKIVNAGSVLIDAGGYAALAAASIRNDGVISARAGTVAFGAGKAMTVDFAGDRLIAFQVVQPLDQASAADGPAIVNGGTIAAGGGTVQISARAAKGVIDNVVNLRGHVIANSVRIDGGTVIYGDGGSVLVSGRLDASSADGVGGAVSILGEKVALADGAGVDVSGATGGGTVLIGGDWQGKGAGRNAAFATVAPAATISADATRSGDGGKVVVWADDTTRFNGAISARGGVESGDGGRVETSGKSALSVGPSALVVTAARATSARAGLWLLDPTDITIASGSLGSTPGGLFAPLTSSSIGTAQISAALATGDVTIQTTGTAAGLGQIAFTGGTISYTGAATRSLSLIAQSDILISGVGADTPAISLSGGAHSVILNAGAQAGAPGGVLLNNARISVSGANSAITIGAGANASLQAQGTAATESNGVTIKGDSKLISGGSITIRGKADPLAAASGVSIGAAATLSADVVNLFTDGAIDGSGAITSASLIVSAASGSLKVAASPPPSIAMLAGAVVINGASFTGSQPSVASSAARASTPSHASIASAPSQASIAATASGSSIASVPSQASVASTASRASAASTPSQASVASMAPQPSSVGIASQASVAATPSQPSMASTGSTASIASIPSHNSRASAPSQNSIQSAPSQASAASAPSHFSAASIPSQNSVASAPSQPSAVSQAAAPSAPSVPARANVPAIAPLGPQPSVASLPSRPSMASAASHLSLAATPSQPSVQSVASQASAGASTPSHASVASTPSTMSTASIPSQGFAAASTPSIASVQSMGSSASVAAIPSRAGVAGSPAMPSQASRASQASIAGTPSQAAAASAPSLAAVPSSPSIASAASTASRASIVSSPSAPSAVSTPSMASAASSQSQPSRGTLLVNSTPPATQPAAVQPTIPSLPLPATQASQASIASVPTLAAIVAPTVAATPSAPSLASVATAPTIANMIPSSARLVFDKPLADTAPIPALLGDLPIASVLTRVTSALAAITVPAVIDAAATTIITNDDAPQNQGTRSGGPGTEMPGIAAVASRAVQAAPSGALIPPGPPTVAGTGAPLAATPTIKVDAQDSGGVYGQVIASTPAPARRITSNVSEQTGASPAAASRAANTPPEQRHSEINEERLID